MKATCSVDGCDRGGLLVRGWCQGHYSRWKRHGDVRAAVPLDPKHWATRGLSVAERLDYYREIPADPDACYGWTGPLKMGYGQISNGDRDVLAHRVAFELEHGPIPADLVIDHECHNRDMSCPGMFDCPHRSCTNLRHLAAKTHAENVAQAKWGERRAAGIGAPYISRCKRNHDLTDPDNVYFDPRGYRYCRPCARLRARSYRERDHT